MDKLYPQDYEKKAKEIRERFSNKPIEQIKKDVKDPNNTLLNNKYKGIHRFYTEEVKFQNPELKNKLLKKKASELSSAVIQTADAMNGWLESIEPNAVRLSVHPQAPFSRKIHLSLSPMVQNITPWQSAAVKTVNASGEEQVYLIKAQEADKLGYKKVLNKEGRPVFYKVPEGQKIQLRAYCESHQPPGLT